MRFNGNETLQKYRDLLEDKLTEREYDVLSHAVAKRDRQCINEMACLLRERLVGQGELHRPDAVAAMGHLDGLAGLTL